MEKNINIDVVSFQQAIDLCVLGFNEKTLCAYEIENQELYLCHLDEKGLYMPKKDMSAPFKSQVFRWFREKYNLLGGVYSNASGWLWEIHDNIGGTHRLGSDYEGDCEYSGAFTSFEKAENACIDKLISWVK